MARSRIWYEFFLTNYNFIWSQNCSSFVFLVITFFRKVNLLLNTRKYLQVGWLTCPDLNSTLSLYWVSLSYWLKVVVNTNMEQNISIRNFSITYKMWQILWGMSVFVSSDRHWMCSTMLKSLAWKTIGLVTSTPVDESNTDVMIFWTLKWDKNDVKLYII